MKLLRELVARRALIEHKGRWFSFPTLTFSSFYKTLFCNGRGVMAVPLTHINTHVLPLPFAFALPDSNCIILVC